jgi:hypothetical protein
VNLWTIRTSVDTRTKSFLETITDTKEHLHEELSLTVQGEAQMTKTLIDAMQRGLETKIAEVEARTERGRGVGIGESPAKLPFDRTLS